MVPHNRPHITDADKAAVCEAMDARRLGPGVHTRRFEDALAERFGRPACVVSSGTVAIMLALRVIGRYSIRIHDYCCSAVEHGARMARVSLTASGEIAWIHADMLGVRDVPPLPDGALVALWDVSTTLGAVPLGKTDVSVASLGATKLLSAGGGGAIFADRDFLDEVRRLMQYDASRAMECRGNWYTSDLHAAFGISQLARFDAGLERRKEIARKYRNAIKPHFYADEPSAPGAHSWYRFCVNTGEQPALICSLRDKGVEAIVPLRADETLSYLSDVPLSPEAVRLCRELVSVPCYPDLSDDEVTQVCAALRECSGMIRGVL
jgi:dTDP-4-amino-4,6-dideoxygalactose transaminase